jgi:hypothetical protein
LDYHTVLGISLKSPFDVEKFDIYIQPSLITTTIKHRKTEKASFNLVRHEFPLSVITFSPRELDRALPCGVDLVCSFGTLVQP